MRVLFLMSIILLSTFVFLFSLNATIHNFYRFISCIFLFMILGLGWVLYAGFAYQLDRWFIGSFWVIVIKLAVVLIIWLLRFWFIFYWNTGFLYHRMQKERKADDKWNWLPRSKELIEPFSYFPLCYVLGRFFYVKCFSYRNLLFFPHSVVFFEKLIFIKFFIDFDFSNSFIWDDEYLQENFEHICFQFWYNLFVYCFSFYYFLFFFNGRGFKQLNLSWMYCTNPLFFYNSFPFPLRNTSIVSFGQILNSIKYWVLLEDSLKNYSAFHKFDSKKKYLTYVKKVVLKTLSTSKKK